MSENSVVKMFQLARLAEWIGDVDKADMLYDKISSGQDGFASIVTSVAKKRRKKMKSLDSIRYLKKQELEKLQNKQKHPMPHEKGVEKLRHKTSIWNYSVSVIGKNEGYNRLEIRGYNPEGKLPKIHQNIFVESHGIKLTNVDIQPNEGKPDLLSISAYSMQPEMNLFLSVDRWGLLHGAAITPEKTIEYALETIHIFICHFANQLWPQKS